MSLFSLVFLNENEMWDETLDELMEGYLDGIIKF